MKKTLIIITVFVLGFAISCKDSFLDKRPYGSVTSDQLTLSSQGVNAVLIAAYSDLTYSWGGDWSESVTNFIWGSVASDDSHKGTDEGDQAPMTDIERYVETPSGSYFGDKWTADYDGISRCNDAIKVATQAQANGAITDAEFNEVVAEARFLRGHYHFDLMQIFGNVPYIDETVTDYYAVGNAESGNAAMVWGKIEDDFKAAMGVLPKVFRQADLGRATFWSAEAYLAKVYMWENKLSDAKPLLDDILNNGPFSLVSCYHDNYRCGSYRNNKESIFEVEFSVGSGSGTDFHANYGEILNYPYGAGPGTCCGFNQPSFDLANAYHVDAAGLPLLDTYADPANRIKTDMGLASSDAYTIGTENLDPRIDWTMGRRGIPYLDWGIMPGSDWIRKQSYGGPYSPIKNVYYKAEEGTNSTTVGWTSGSDNNNYRMLRLDHIILWRAEIAASESDLPKALTLVNQIRTRADFCHVQADGSDDDGTHANDAATYLVNPYPSFPSKAYAVKAVQFETRLEEAMEGTRFFDLVRWGIADQVMNTYFKNESAQGITYLVGVKFTKGKNEVFPLPQNQIDIMGSDILKQNPGY